MILSELVLSQLVYNKDYFRKCIPYLKPEYFNDVSEREIFKEICKYAVKYRKQPSTIAISIEMQNRKDLNEDLAKGIGEKIDTLKEDNVSDQQWLIDQTESFCRDRAIYLALQESISIAEGENKKLTKDAIPDILKQALAISFDPSVGHDYFEDASKAWDAYHEETARTPFKWDIVNRVTRGGVPPKTLNLILAGTNSFKTGTMCDLAAHYVAIGKNVLYITLEMAEHMIRERIDANLMKITIDNVHLLPKGLFIDKVKSIKSKTQGRFVIKEFPTASAHVGHFRALIGELELKKDFKPDIIIIDYLSICLSSRYKSDNMYSMNKAIAEELRGLAAETNTIMWSGVQTNRSGQNNSDPELENVGESHGISATADFMLALIITPELEEKNMIMMKQLKSRYGDKSKFTKFMLGIDKARMTLYEIDKDQMTSIPNDTSLHDEETIFDNQFPDTDLVPFTIKSSTKVNGSNFKFV